jgi:hypothetical protein
MTLLAFATLREKCNAVMQSKSIRFLIGNTIKLRGSPNNKIVPS